MVHFAEVTAILLTCDGRLDLFKRAVISISRQTLLPNEVIIVNAGMPSKEWVLKKKFVDEKIKQMPKIIFLECSNQMQARNKAVHNSTNDWIAFLDDDDEWDPLKIQTQYALIDKDIGIICSNYFEERIDGSKTLFSVGKNCNPANISILAENNVGSTSFPLVSKRYYLMAGGFDSRFKSNQEWDLWVRMTQKARIKTSNICAGIKYRSMHSISTNPIRRLSGWNRFFFKHFALYIKNLTEFEHALGFCFRELYYLKLYVPSMVYFSLYSCIFIINNINKK